MPGYYKSLALAVPPDREHEGPVLVSPVRTDSYVCSRCRHGFGPLIYAPFRETWAQHFHRSGYGNGGIYLLRPYAFAEDGTPAPPPEGALFRHGHFAAPAETLGTVSEADARAEGVRLGGIMARCATCVRRLESGVLVDEWLDQSTGRLVPLHDRPACWESLAGPAFNNRRARYEFSIRDGSLLITQPEPAYA